MTKPVPGDRSVDFSLVLGGPLYQLLRRSRLAGDALELLRRRILTITLLAWLPLLLLSVLGGSALGGGIKVPFLHDVEMHVKFLVALPVLILAELVVHLRIRPTVQAFLGRGIVPPGEVPRFDAAIASVVRARNSVALELALVAVVYTLGLWIWRSQTALEATTWYARPDGGHLNLTPAGYWYVLVSLPIFQFILLRWYLRLLLWFAFLWRVTRLDLRLIPTHPDRAGGLGFLGQGTYASGPILFAQGALLSGSDRWPGLPSRVPNLMDFKVQIVGFVAIFLALILGPLTVFTPLLAPARRRGLSELRDARQPVRPGVRGEVDSAAVRPRTTSSWAPVTSSRWPISERIAVDPGDARRALRCQGRGEACRDGRRAAGARRVLTIFSLDDLVTQLLKAIF